MSGWLEAGGACVRGSLPSLAAALMHVRDVRFLLLGRIEAVSLDTYSVLNSALAPFPSPRTLKLAGAG